MQSTSEHVLEITRPSELDSLSELRRALDSWLVACAVAEEARAAIVLAGHEAAVNAVHHAGSAGPFAVRAQLEDRRVEVVVTDRGRWKPALFEDEERGRGLVLIRALMHEVEIDCTDDGTAISMRYLLDEPVDPA